MKLKRVHIKNYRSCKDVSIEIGSMQALVGANNAGKSSIIRALDFLFNPSTTKVDKETFWNGDAELQIWVEVIFDELSDAEKKDEKLKPFLRPDDTFHIARSAIWKIDEQEEEGALPDDGKPFISQHFCKPMPKYDWLQEGKINGNNINEWWENKDDLKVGDADFLDYVGTAKPKVGDWKEKAKEFIENHLSGDDFIDAWNDNPQGYAGVLKGTLPHFIFVPAVRDITDEAKVTKTNPFGKLLYAVLESVTGQQKVELETTLEGLQKRLNRIGGADRLESIVETEKKLNDVLKEYMACDLEIEFQSPSVETLLTTPQLFADDGFRNIVSNKGHGLQRAIIFSILRCYSELVTGSGDKKKKPMIFAVEEPELYMHPLAQHNIRRVFRGIADKGDQVMFSTHSSLLLDVAYFDEVIRVEAVQEKIDKKNTVRSVVWQLTMEAMIEDLKARHGVEATDDSIRERYSHAYHPNRSEGFFAKSIILVEGATEQYALPIYAERAGYPLDALNISVVDSGGKGTMDRLYRIFNELGIPCFMLFDYDQDNDDINIVDKSKELLELLGEDTVPPDKISIGDNMACFPNKWEMDLAAEIPDVERLTADARKEMGLYSDSGKPLIARYIAKKLTSQEPPIVPDSIKSILEKAVVVKWEKCCLCKLSAEEVPAG
jgi:predicted ATP-dependent endonuclease of OLD family